jgi:hypothetical protein
VNHIESVSSAVARIRAPLFLARINDNGATLSVHTADRTGRRALFEQASRELQRDGIALSVNVVTHRRGSLARRQSIEALNRSFGTGAIAYDPTGIVSRSAAVLVVARRLRQALADRLAGVYLNAERRALFVILERSRFAANPESFVAERVAVMAEVTEVTATWRRDDRPDFDLAVRIGFELPAGVNIVPVDRESARWSLRLRLNRHIRRPGLIAALASAMGIGLVAPAGAADVVRAPARPAPTLAIPLKQPAVARPNIDFLVAGGWLDGNGFNNDAWGAVGLKATVPVGNQFGFQVDAAVGEQKYWGLGGHLFWRDPARGLLGAFATTESMNDVSMQRYAVEGEAYRGNVTLRGEIGSETRAGSSAVFGGLDVIFYANPNLSLSLGGEFTQSRSVARATLEWQPALPALSGLSVFADGQVGTNGFSKVLAGVSFHFGTAGVSLLDRDRKYDPKFALFNNAARPPVGYVKP